METYGSRLFLNVLVLDIFHFEVSYGFTVEKY